MLLCALLLGLLGVAQADDPISVSMDLSKSQFTGVDDVTVSIKVSNKGDDRMPGPVYLYYPNGKAVANFGDGGAVMLELGGFETWTGTWRVTQKQLEDGKISFLVKYPIVNENGDIDYKSKYYGKSIVYNGAVPGLNVNRTCPTMARKDQTVTVVYDLSNTGNVTLTNIKITENKSISSKAVTIDSLAANESKQVKFEVAMGSKDLSSSATITYKAAGAKDTLKQTIEPATIALGEANLSASLSPSAAGVNIGETVKLTLTLKNQGNIGYKNVTVTDPGLGEILSNQELAAGETKTVEKDVILMANAEYTFTVKATDTTGQEVSITTDKVDVSAVDPNKKLILTVNATADTLEVYSQPAIVRFDISVTNASETEAKDVALKHGDTRIYTFPSIKPGETKRIVREANISMAGKFRFTATCKDLLNNDVTFESNELSIVYSVLTPAPTTVPQRTPQPLVTEPLPTGAGLPSAFSTAKSVSYILFTLFVILFGGSILLVAFAFAKRLAQKRQSDAALDHLERGTRRDYTVPGEEDDSSPAVYHDGGENQDGTGEDSFATYLQDEELPHMKYVRGDYAQPESSSDNDADDSPKAEGTSRELTEEEAAILSGGTGHYRLTRPSVPSATDEDKQSEPLDTSRRHRRAARPGNDEQSLDL